MCDWGPKLLAKLEVHMPRSIAKLRERERSTKCGQMGLYDFSLKAGRKTILAHLCLDHQEKINTISLDDSGD